MAVGTSITLRLAWADTDASGHWHYTTLFRFAEDAEAQLHRELGIAERTWGSTPRVHVEGDFRRPVWFDDEVEVTIRVDRLGRTTVHYDIACAVAGDVVATAKVVSVLIGEDRRPLPWPDDLAAALRGEQPA
jgi:acyl-CoA thioesterase FadM